MLPLGGLWSIAMPFSKRPYPTKQFLLFLGAFGRSFSILSCPSTVFFNNFICGLLFPFYITFGGWFLSALLTPGTQHFDFVPDPWKRFMTAHLWRLSPPVVYCSLLYITWGPRFYVSSSIPDCRIRIWYAIHESNVRVISLLWLSLAWNDLVSTTAPPIDCNYS